MIPVMEFLIALGVMAVLALTVLAVMALVMPSVGQTSERARIEREAQAASWRIHQQATRAFSRMLDAAREAEKHEGRP